MLFEYCLFTLSTLSPRVGCQWNLFLPLMFRRKTAEYCHLSPSLRNFIKSFKYFQFKFMLYLLNLHLVLARWQGRARWRQKKCFQTLTLFLSTRDPRPSLTFMKNLSELEREVRVRSGPCWYFMAEDWEKFKLNALSTLSSQLFVLQKVFLPSFIKDNEVLRCFVNYI